MRKLLHCDVTPKAALAPGRQCFCPLVHLAWELVPLRLHGRTRVLERPWWHCPDCGLALAILPGVGTYSSAFPQPHRRPRQP